VKVCPELNLTETQKLGLCYYGELSAVVTRAETEAIVDYTREQLESCAPGTIVQAVGGYRRWCMLYTALLIIIIVCVCTVCVETSPQDMMWIFCSLTMMTQLLTIF